MVRAKFRVTQIASNKWDANSMETFTVKLTPVTSGSEENKRFYAATPGGQIELSVVRAEAVAELKLGSEVYVDFTPAEE